MVLVLLVVSTRGRWQVALQRSRLSSLLQAGGPEGSWTPDLGLVDMVMVGAGPLNSPWGSRLFVPSVSPLIWPSCPLSLTATVEEPCGITLQHDSQVRPGSKATQPGGGPEDHSAAGWKPGDWRGGPRVLGPCQEPKLQIQHRPRWLGSSSPSPLLCSPPPSLHLCRVPVCVSSL